MQVSRTRPRRRREPEGPAAALARALQDRRHHLNLTQQDVADLADLARSTVLELESGHGGSSLGSAVRVADVLGLRLVLEPQRFDHDE